MATIDTPSKPQVRATASKRAVALRKHYDLLYWWIVWAYAGVAWLMTELGGTTINFGSKALKIYPGPALGVGFVFLLLFVAVFTAIRARGAMSAILFLSLIVAGLILYLTGGWSLVISRVPDLHVHMNQAFYGVVFAVLFPTWLLTTFVFNRMNYFIFHPGKRIEKGRLIGGGGNAAAVSALAITRLDDDIFIHRILGLRWMGFGTGDVEVSYSEPGKGTTIVTITNVWRVHDVLRRFNELDR